MQGLPLNTMQDLYSLARLWAWMCGIDEPTTLEAVVYGWCVFNRGVS